MQLQANPDGTGLALGYAQGGLTMRKSMTALALGAALAACGLGDDPGSSVGHVGMAVVTTGADGALYRLTPGTRLALALASDPSQVSDFALDGDGAVVTVRLAPGDYQASIYHPDGNFTSQWPLERTNGNEPMGTVTATLVTPQPVAVTVMTGQTTSLVFQFNVASGGTLTFDRGTVETRIGVATVPASSLSVGADGTGAVAGTPTFGGPAEPALRAVMPGAGATGLSVAVTAHTTGAWQDSSAGSFESGFFICAPAQIDSATAGGNDGFAALIAESGHGSAPSFFGGPANICVIDFGPNSPNQIRIRLSREGVAETATLTAALGAAPALFHNQILGVLPVRVYDNQAGTLDLDALLVAGGTLPMTVKAQIRDESDFSSFWYRAVITGQLTFSIVGQP
jgi:hypothetical protein